jgi:hypothetical protein
MKKRGSKQRSAIKETESFVREALTKISKKQPSESTVRAVAKKVARVLPQRVEA